MPSPVLLKNLVSHYAFRLFRRQRASKNLLGFAQFRLDLLDLDLDNLLGTHFGLLSVALQLLSIQPVAVVTEGVRFSQDQYVQWKSRPKVRKVAKPQAAPVGGEPPSLRF